MAGSCVHLTFSQKEEVCVIHTKNLSHIIMYLNKPSYWRYNSRLHSRKRWWLRVLWQKGRIATYSNWCVWHYCRLFCCFGGARCYETWGAHSIHEIVFSKLHRKRKVKVLQYYLNQFFLCGYTKRFKQMLLQHLIDMNSSDAKFFRMKEANHHPINETGTWPLLKLVAKAKKFSSLNQKGLEQFSVVKGYFDFSFHSVEAPVYLQDAIGRCLVDLSLQLHDNANYEQVIVGLVVSMTLLKFGRTQSLFTLSRRKVLACHF